MSTSSKSGAGLVPSILDRLSDDHPDLSSEVYTSPSEERRRFRQSVYRDLTFLLNYRRADADIPAEFKRIRMSVLAYGIPDFSSFDLTNKEDQKNICRGIETAIRLFEPRLTRVSVQQPSSDDISRRLHFRLEAWLRLGAETEPARFRASLARDSRRFEVAGED